MFGHPLTPYSLDWASKILNQGHPLEAFVETNEATYQLTAIATRVIDLESNPLDLTRVPPPLRMTPTPTRVPENNRLMVWRVADCSRYSYVIEFVANK